MVGKDGVDLFPDRNLTKRFSAESQENQAKTWSDLCPTSQVIRERTIQSALDRVRGLAIESNRLQILITGSLHLVSGAICLLEQDKM